MFHGSLVQLADLKVCTMACLLSLVEVKSHSRFKDRCLSLGFQVHRLILHNMSVTCTFFQPTFWQWLEQIKTMKTSFCFQFRPFTSTVTLYFSLPVKNWFPATDHVWHSNCIIKVWDVLLSGDWRLFSDMVLILLGTYSPDNFSLFKKLLPVKYKSYTSQFQFAVFK